jgi:hypothetical protein
MNQPETDDVPAPEQLEYLLRRAEQESIAAVRSVDPRAAQPHEDMASAYSAQVVELLER